MDETVATPSRSLADLPPDELLAYGRDLGLTTDPGAQRGEVLRLIRERQELLLELDREAMLDVVKWARIPVRRSISKEQLARHIASISRVRFDDLSDHGLRALARLRGVESAQTAPRELIQTRLRRLEGLWARLRRKRRRLVGSWVSQIIEGPRAEGDYQFLPEDDDSASLKDSIEESGVMSGIAHRLRGAADHYVREKLDEIERRIDGKLDEIDRRLAEWRDQEIKIRLRIVKITLLAAIVVAVISLGYDYLKERHQPAAHPASPVAATGEADRER